MKTRISLVFFAVVFALPGATVAQDGCAVIDQIIDSGLDRQNPFAAVAGVTLPNADYCEVEFGGEWNEFSCSWNEENGEALDRMEEEVDRLWEEVDRLT